jgi:vitamin B12 transporter
VGRRCNQTAQRCLLVSPETGPEAGTKLTLVPLSIAAGDELGGLTAPCTSALSANSPAFYLNPIHAGEHGENVLMFFRVSFLATAVAACSVSTQAIAADQLEEVVVTASRTEQPISEVIGSVTVITREEIEQRQAQSLQDLLRGELGIDIYNSGGLGKLSGLSIRGAKSEQTLFLVDGVRLGSASAGLTSFELIPVDQIERIEIIRGPRSSLYGSDAIGGVIQIFTRKNTGITASISAGSYDTQNYNLGLGTSNDKLKFSLHINHLQSGGYDSLGSYNIYPAPTYSPVLVTETDKDNFDSSSITTELGYKFNSAISLELTSLYAEGLTRYDGSPQNETRFRNSAPNFKLHLMPLDILELTLTGGITQDVSEGYMDGVFVSRFFTEKQSAGTQFDWDLKEQKITFGLDYLIDDLTSDTSYTVSERKNTGIYAQYLASIDKHEFSASLRSDRNDQFGGHTTNQLGWKWFVLNKDLALNAGWGQAFRAPTFNDLYYPFGFGNPALKPEQSESYEIGISGILDSVNWSAQAYSTNVTDMIAWNNTTNQPDNISKAKLKGAELNINGQWKKVSFNVNYSAQEPRTLQPGNNYENILPRRARQSGRVNLGYKFNNAQLSTNININGPRFDDLDNKNPMGGYTTVDLLGNIELRKQSGFSIQVKLGNFFNRTFATTLGWDPTIPYKQEGRSVYLTLRYQPKK